jgi:hypothetical protein
MIPKELQNMNKKKLVLFVFLTALTAILGLLLGKINFFGFLSQTIELNLIYLVFSFLVWYLISFVLFLLNLESGERKKQVFLITSLLFGLVYFLVNSHFLSAILLTLFYFFFLMFVLRVIKERERLFVKFYAHGILFPVIRTGFIFLAVILSTIVYFQAYNRARQASLVSPAVIEKLTRPFINIFNKRFSSELQRKFGTEFEQTIGTQQKQDIARFVVEESIESMTEGTSRQYFGINLNNLPLQKIEVYDNGDINLNPLIASIAPKISNYINSQAQTYYLISPLIIAILVVAAVSPLTAILGIVLYFPTLLAISILLKTGFLHKETKTVEKELLRL